MNTAPRLPTRIAGTAREAESDVELVAVLHHLHFRFPYILVDP